MNKNKLSKYFRIYLVIQSISNLLGTLQYLFLSISIFQIQAIIILITGLFFIILIDYIKYYQINVIKISIYLLFSGMVLITLFLPDQIQFTQLYTGDPTIKPDGILLILGSIISFQICVISAYTVVTIYFYYKNTFKESLYLILIGGFIFGMGFIIFVFKFSKYFPGGMAITINIGIFFITISFKKYPGLIDNLFQRNLVAKVKLIKKILPICSYCKNIKDEDGKWYNLEDFFRDEIGTQFSHGICPDCQKQHFSKYI